MHKDKLDNICKFILARYQSSSLFQGGYYNTPKIGSRHIEILCNNSPCHSIEIDITGYDKGVKVNIFFNLPDTVKGWYGSWRFTCHNEIRGSAKHTANTIIKSIYLIVMELIEGGKILPVLKKGRA